MWLYSGHCSILFLGCLETEFTKSIKWVVIIRNDFKRKFEKKCPRHIANANFEALFSNQCHNLPFKIREKEKEPTFYYDWSIYWFTPLFFEIIKYTVHRPVRVCASDSETNFETM